MKELGRTVSRLGMGLAGVLSLTAAGFAAETPSKYPTMAPVAQYRMESREAEIALARSAAPPSISNDAGVLVLGAKGYETASKGTNGFVCLVLLSWNAPFDDPEFWNQNIRGPACLNAAAVRSVLPHHLERARWALSGVTRKEMQARTMAQIASHTYLMPEEGAMSYMMSRHQRLNDAGGHWHPHLMFYIGNAAAADWGANLKGSPVFAGPMAPEPVTIFFVPVAKWSDGTEQTMEMK